MTNNADVGKLILRIVVGGLILLHGIHKLQFGIAGISHMVAGHGLPGFVAYGVYIGEVVGPVMVLLGLYTRIGAALIAINMLFVFGLAHLGQLFTLTGSGGWELELQGMYLFAALALCFLGSGRYALRN